MRADIDSDVLILHLRGEPKALGLLQRLRDDENVQMWIGAMQRAEVLFFMRPKEESQTLLFLAQFQTAVVNQQIVDQAGLVYRKWSPRCGIDINEALLAATALQTGGTIYTLNLKHYPLPGIDFQSGMVGIERTGLFSVSRCPFYQ